MQPLKLIKINSSGPLVKAWQFFLRGQELYQDEIDGKFGPNTKTASIEFQRNHGLQPDGIVGNKTFGVAMLLGFEGVEDNRKDISGANFPPKPSFNPLVNNAARQKQFGTFTYVHEPQPGNFENIRITNNWVRENIVTVPVPQLKQITGGDKMQFHKKVAPQLTKLWKDWQDADLLHLVLTFDGSYVARFVRGSTSVLSNHAFGTAFDINVTWNRLGAVPALVGQKGSVRELAGIANDNGFYWGGHFTRLDGMHFEVAKIIS
jgi:peptidoglycan hydrolase-like protein with peptidoglycan-binding domain